MSSDTLDGGLTTGAGKIESAAGALLDRPDLQARGEARQIEGKAQDVIAVVQDAVTQAADKVSASAAKFGDQARGAYGQATDRVRDVAERVDPMVQDRPYVAVGLAVAAGLLVGLLLASRGPKIVYIRPPA